MNILFLTLALFGADDRNQAGAAHMQTADINGSWQVVYAECHGNPLTAARATSIVIRDNTITFGPDSLRYTDQAGSPGRPVQSTEPRRPRRSDNSPPSVDEAGNGRSNEEKMAALRELTKHNWRLEFGPDQSVKAQPIANGVGDQTRQIPQGRGGDGASGHQAMAKSGVYIATKDYLALCFHKAGKHSERINGTARVPQNAPQASVGQQPTSGEFVVILRRQGASGPAPGQIPGQVPARPSGVQ